MARTSFRTAAALAIMVIAACGGGPKHIGAITPEVQDRLSGAWVLNAAESDDAREVMDAARGGAGPVERRPNRGGRGSVPPEDRMRPGGGRGGDPGAMRATMRLATVPPRELDVALSDSMVTVRYGQGDVWALPFGKTVKREVDGAPTLEAKAEWDNGRLVVRRSVSGGGSVTETFMPSVDGTRLTVVVESEGGGRGGRGGVEFRRVYDARRPR